MKEEKENIKSVFCGYNGRLIVYNYNGEKIPELSGQITSEKYLEIEKRRDLGTEIQGDFYNEFKTEYKNSLEKDRQDKLNIPLRTAYAKIIEWYIANIADAPKNSQELISVFPKSEEATELEMRCIMSEVIGGNLEYAGYKNGDGEFYWSDYAEASYGSVGFKHLNKKEVTEIKKSKLFQYLHYGYTIPKTFGGNQKDVEELLKDIEKSKKK